MVYDNIDPVEVLADKVRYCIDNNQEKELVDSLKAADFYLSDRKDLMFDAYFFAGESSLKNKDSYNAILYFNKARKFNHTIVSVFDKLIESLISFYTPNKDRFIKTDLTSLIPPIKNIINYYISITPDSPYLNKGLDLLNSIAYRIEFIAPDAVEGQMTHRVNEITNALDKEVPIEQVKKEVGKFIADLLKKRKKNQDNESETKN